MMNSNDFVTLLRENNKSNNAILKESIREGLKEELRLFEKEIKEMVSKSLSELSARIERLERKIQEKDEEMQSLKNELENKNDKTVELQFESKKRNILLFKVNEREVGPTSLRNIVVDLIKRTADPTFSEVDVDCVYRLGARGGISRPIKVELQRSSKRNFLLSHKKKFTEKNISIAEDLPKEVIDFRKPLYKVADNLRRSGRRVQFKKNKFIVDGVEWNCSQIKTALESGCTQIQRASEEVPLRTD